MGSAIFLSACSKDQQAGSPGEFKPSAFSSSSWESMEYYVPDDSLNLAINDALWHLDQNIDLLGTTSIARGIWTIETGINYAFGDQPYLDYEELELTESYQLDLTEEATVLEADLKAVLVDLNGIIKDQISANTGFIVADVFIEDMNTSIITLGVKIVFAHNHSGVNEYPETVTLIPSATVDRQAGFPLTCSNTPTNVVWQDCGDRAKSVMRSFIGTPSGSFNFWTNVRYLSSTAIGSRNINPTKLFGHSQAVVSTHRSNLHGITCVTIAEQNDYAAQIYYDVTGMLPYGWGVATLIMKKNSDYSEYQTNWTYQSVVIGENSSTLNAPQLPTYL